MMYWSSTKSPVHLFKREYESAKAAEYVCAHSFVDPSRLAADLKVSHYCIQAYQRRLGVRRIARNNEARA